MAGFGQQNKKNVTRGQLRLAPTKKQKEEKDMAQFYGEIKGQARTSATRRGSKASGLEGHLRGWNIGVRVVLEYKEGIGDIIHIYRTSGSNGGDEDVLIATLQDYN